MTEQNTTPIDLDALKSETDKLAADMVSAQQSGDMALFNTLVVSYTEKLQRYNKARQEANAEKISQAKSQLAGSIRSVVDSLGLADLIGEPIKSVTYTISQDADGNDIVTVGVNAKPSTGRRKGTGGGPREGQRDLRAIFDQQATDEDRAELAALEAERDASADADEKKKIGAKIWALRNKVANRS